MHILYDCVQTLAEHIGPVLAFPEVVNQLMPALIDRWNKVPDQSREMFPLLECLSYVAMALNEAFTPYAEPIFRRCVQIISSNIEQNFAAQSNPGLDQPDKDFLVTALDLISAIIQALSNENATTLVQSSPVPFFELVSFCMEDVADEVRQSAYAVLGDCAKYVYPQLQPSLSKIFPILLKQLDMDTMLDEEMDSGFGVVNNALWSAGEIAMQHGKDIDPFIPELMQRFVEIMNHPHVPKSVSENAATALGRLGLDNAQILSQHLGQYAEAFLAAMDDVNTSEEKATAFKGFARIVAQNPAAMENSILHFFTAIARFPELKYKTPMRSELAEAFQNVINIYKTMIGDFNSFLGKLDPRDQQALMSTYQL